MASDGKWYPPHLHPGTGSPEPEEAVEVAPAPVTEDSGETAGHEKVAPGLEASTTTNRRFQRRRVERREPAARESSDPWHSERARSLDRGEVEERAVHSGSEEFFVKPAPPEEPKRDARRSSRRRFRSEKA